MQLGLVMLQTHPLNAHIITRFIVADAHGRSFLNTRTFAAWNLYDGRDLVMSAANVDFRASPV